MISAHAPTQIATAPATCGKGSSNCKFGMNNAKTVFVSAIVTAPMPAACRERAAFLSRSSPLVSYFTNRPSLRNWMSGGIALPGASTCGTCPRPGSSITRPLPLGIALARNCIRS